MSVWEARHYTVLDSCYGFSVASCRRPCLDDYRDHCRQTRPIWATYAHGRLGHFVACLETCRLDDWSTETYCDYGLGNRDPCSRPVLGTENAGRED